MENFILGIKNFFNFNSSQKENKKILNLTPLEN